MPRGLQRPFRQRILPLRAPRDGQSRASHFRFQGGGRHSHRLFLRDACRCTWSGRGSCYVAPGPDPRPIRHQRRSRHDEHSSYGLSLSPSCAHPGRFAFYSFVDMRRQLSVVRQGARLCMQLVTRFGRQALHSFGCLDWFLRAELAYPRPLRPRQASPSGLVAARTAFFRWLGQISRVRFAGA